MDATTALTFVSILGASMLAGIGAAMGWFRLQRKALLASIQAIKTSADEEVRKLWEELREVHNEVAHHSGDIRVLDEQIHNNVRRLDQIYDNTEKVSVKIDALSQTFTKLLIETRLKRED